MISPMVLNTPTVLKISPTFIMISPHGTEHPHGTQDIPHGTHDIPPRYWTPPTVLHTLYRVIQSALIPLAVFTLENLQTTLAWSKFASTSVNPSDGAKTWCWPEQYHGNSDGTNILASSQKLAPPSKFYQFTPDSVRLHQLLRRVSTNVFRSSLMKFSFTKNVQTKFSTPQNPSIDTWFSKYSYVFTVWLVKGKN